MIWNIPACLYMWTQTWCGKKYPLIFFKEEKKNTEDYRWFDADIKYTIQFPQTCRENWNDSKVQQSPYKTTFKFTIDPDY